jgi:hypothetical protein
MKRQLISVLALFAALATATPPPWSALDVSWNSPSPSSQEDGMPSGNGMIAALVWGNVTSGGLDFVVRSPMAMATDSTLLDITTVSLTLSPNPCAPGSYWNQTHHLEDGSVTLLCGGSSFANYTVGWRFYVDANADTVVAVVTSRDGVAAFNLTATLRNERPGPGPLKWNAAMHCPVHGTNGQTTPDVVAPAGAPFAPGTVALYHVNSLAAGDTPFFHNQLAQQGLAALSAQFPDPLDGRVFGAALAGAAGADGAGAPLVPADGALSLASAAPAAAFLVRLDARVDAAAGGDAARFLAALAAQAAGGPAPAARAAASDAWWAAFWARSYVNVVGGARGPPPNLLAAQYARTRFIQAVQSRGHRTPIKFNGQLWSAKRAWGPDYCACLRVEARALIAPRVRRRRPLCAPLNPPRSIFLFPSTQRRRVAKHAPTVRQHAGGGRRGRDARRARLGVRLHPARARAHSGAPARAGRDILH